MVIFGVFGRNMVFQMAWNTNIIQSESGWTYYNRLEYQQS